MRDATADAAPPTRDAPPGVGAAWFEAGGDAGAAVERGLAHELRAPLRGIDGYAARLAARGDVALDAGARDQLQRIREAAARMGTLVDGLHRHAQARHAPLRMEDVDVGLLAEWVGAELQDFAPGRAARITVAPGLSARGDEYWLRIALGCVLDNAWRFSAVRARVEIDVDGGIAGDRLRLCVRDAGIGFDPAHGHKLFQPFQRLHGAGEGAGAGLGLATAWCIVQRHGGRMRIRGAPDAGCTVEIELPCGASTAAEGAPAD